MLPAIYRDGHVATAVYAVPFDRARDAVAPPELQPIEFPGRKAFAVVCCFDYLDTTLGPYRELAVGVIVSSRRRLGSIGALDLMSANPNTGAWLTALPVSSELACSAGVEVFGYPKSLCRINVRHSSSFCSADVEDNFGSILRLEVPLGWGPKVPVRWLVTYSRRSGQLLRTRVETRWRVTLCSGRGTRLDIQNTQHPLSLALQQLVLPRSPLFVLHGDRFSAILRAGERI